MSVPTGAIFGQYAITALLGQGGMGTVYRATDRKLKREVAIKFLPEAFADDSDRLARFQREAESLAALNHPNIAAIHDLQEADGHTFLVLELVEGETLEELVARRHGLPVDEALQIASQICAALEAAHERGIVHRDLKPSNIKIAPGDTVKLLDFGLATMSESPGHEAPADSRTRTEPSVIGGVVGTPAYMAPEQVRGQPVDTRVDVWAFGCVLYQMLTGLAPNRGASTADTFALIVAAEPDWTKLSPSTPPAVRALLRHALQKDRRHRLAHIADARLWIEDALAHVTSDSGEGPPAVPRHQRWWWAGWVAALAAALAAGVAWRGGQPAGPPELRVQIVTPPNSDPASIAVSPDGSRLVFPASAEGKTQLWIRPLDALTAQPLAGTEGATFPFWSPRGDAVGFFADGQLKRIDAAGGVPVVVAKAPLGRGGTWNAAGVMLFTPSGTGPIYRVAETSGAPVPVTALDPAHMSHRFPQFLPDGEHFLYFAAGQSPGLFVASLAGGASKRIVGTEAAGVLTPDGMLLFLREGALFAQPFDPAALELRGQPTPIAEQVAVDSGAFLGGFAAARDVLAYRTGGAGRRQLTWFDRTGKAIETVGTPDSGVLTGAELAPNGSRVAINRMLNGNLDVWLIDIAKGSLTRVTFEAALDGWPHWLADGSRIVFSSNTKGTYNLYDRPATAAGGDRLILETEQAKIPQDVSPDNTTLLFASLDAETGFDLWTVPVAGGTPRVFLKTPFQESGAQYSPDGRWIAYHSNESGRYEVYVQATSGGQEGRMQVSTAGGAQPRWRRDGRELFYVSLDSHLVAVPVTTSTTDMLDIGTATTLFPVNIVGGPVLLNNTQQYTVSADGERFLVNVAIDATPPINLLFNWNRAATP